MAKQGRLEMFRKIKMALAAIPITLALTTGALACASGMPGKWAGPAVEMFFLAPNGQERSHMIRMCDTNRKGDPGRYRAWYQTYVDGKYQKWRAVAYASIVDEHGSQVVLFQYPDAKDTPYAIAVKNGKAFGVERLSGGNARRWVEKLLNTKIVSGGKERWLYRYGGGARSWDPYWR